MQAIWKYAISRTVGDIEMPRGAQILCVQIQDDDICLWATVNTDAPKEIRTFVIYGTGHNHPVIEGVHIGTVQQRGLVWHVFEKK